MVTQKLYSIYALDLEISKINYKERNKKLDKYNISQEKIEKIYKSYESDLEKKGASILPRHLYVPVPLYRKETPQTNPYSCEDIRDLIIDKVEKFGSEVDYTGLNTLTSFLEFFEEERFQNPSITAVEVFTKFKPNSSGEAELNHASSCVGQSLAVLQMLKKDFDLNGYVVVETAHLNSPPNHAAAIIPCNDGVLLLETFEKEPIILIKPNEKDSRSLDEGKTKIFYEIKKISEDKTYIIKTVELEDKISNSYFRLLPIKSPDHTVMKNYILDKPFYPIVAKGADGNKRIIKVNYALDRVTFQIGMGENERKLIFSFSDFDVETKRINTENVTGDEFKLFLSNEFFKEFHVPERDLMDQIFMMVRHKDTIKSLYAEVKRT